MNFDLKWEKYKEHVKTRSTVSGMKKKDISLLINKLCCMEEHFKDFHKFEDGKKD